MTKPTPNRYQVTDYKSPVDPRRMALLRDSIVDRYLTVATEDEARDLIAQLTAWLDAPRLSARETAEVVARDDEYGFRLLRTTAGEWGVLWQDNEDDEADGEIHWHATVAEAQEAFESQPMRCKDEPCGWTGTGADLIAAGSLDGNDSPHECPKCCGWTVYEADDATGGGQ